jgi:hypothetical protein
VACVVKTMPMRAPRTPQLGHGRAPHPLVEVADDLASTFTFALGQGLEELLDQEAERGDLIQQLVAVWGSPMWWCSHRRYLIAPRRSMTLRGYPAAPPGGDR